MQPMYAHGLSLMQPPTPAYVRKVVSPTDSRPLPTLLTAVRPTSSTQKSCEEGLQDDEEDEEEGQGPSLEYTFWGVDFKPILPAALASSTIIGAICMMTVQIPILSRMTLMSQAALSAAFSVLYAVTLGCMTYCAFADPGQVKRTRNAQLGMDLEKGMPRRAHKSWQYPRPIRRYDHYCKWLKNTIGLLNHREFVTLLMCLTLISFLGIMIDLWVAVLVAEMDDLQREIIVVLHLAYSIALLAIEGPMLRIHVGLISRNETAQEWKKKQNYVAHDTSLGDDVPVEQLDDDEYNSLFDQDAFVYDRTMNPFDKGILSNCWSFWCMPRWPADENGEW
ncbi:unnamed protein product [Effrenium voratum]|nr:unnamed protein product [Effrenium voratum]